MEVIEVAVNDLQEYENNPRNNDNAVLYVAESIKQCGYVAPIIVDENMVILAGHTRLKALKFLGYEKCEVIIKRGLTEEQKKKYRILDNKTSEYAEWDMDLLSVELEDIDFDGFDFGFDLDSAEAAADDSDDTAEATEAPDDFKEYGDDIETEHKCPMCGYEW